MNAPDQTRQHRVVLPTRNMSNVDLDTDSLLAILSSLLDPPIPEQHVLLDALVHFNGNPEKAAQSLRRKQTSGPGIGASRSSRRPTGTILDFWQKSSTKDGPQRRRRGVSADNKRSTSPGILRSRLPAVDKASTSKPTGSLSKVLRSAGPSRSAPPRPRPLTLSNPTMVEKHTPCTMNLGVLPTDLALRLFQVMVEASKEWKPNKWWLFERVVESPHKTSFYVRQADGTRGDTLWQEAAQYWYNGRPTAPPKTFPPEMEEACQVVEKVVNDVISKRSRYALEWGGAGSEAHTWKANVAAANCYTGARDGVGFHSDQLTYLGPYPTIASLSLGTTRIFRLREVTPKAETCHAQTFNIPVVHNSLLIMHATTQERFKHSIPAQNAIDLFRPSALPDMASNCRINITFRFYRPDFEPPSIPRCRCDIPCVLRADMKGREESDAGVNMRYFWMCYGGAQNEGKGCSFFKVMDCRAEGRGPFVGDHKLAY